MGVVYRFKAVVSGFIGGPGVNTWHMCQFEELGGAAQSDLEGMATDISAVYNAVKGQYISGLKVRLDSAVEGFDIATGNLVSVTGISVPAEITGGGSGSNISRSEQITVRLQTDAIRGNRQVQGRHFIGPIAANAMGNDGQILAASRAQVEAAYGGVTDFTGNGRLVVWAQPNEKHPRPDARAGRIGYVQGVLANATPGTLRSRKV